MASDYFCAEFMASQPAEVQDLHMAKNAHPNRIEEMRKAKGLTLEELAERSGFSTPFVWQMANGVRNVKLANLERLATALECRPEDLLNVETGKTNTDILNLWAAIPPDRRQLALTVLQSMAKSDVDSPPSFPEGQFGEKTNKRQKRNRK